MGSFVARSKRSRPPRRRVLAVSLAVLLAAALSPACGGDRAGDPLSDAECPPSPIRDGDPCDSARPCMTGEDCGLAMVCVCASDRRYQCDPVDFAASCAGIDDARCSIEGNFGCETPPPSGTRTCVDGAWIESSSCPTTCPELLPPQPGSPCDIAPGVTCPYDGVTCTCTGGAFDCS